jgi:S1-C subfamily serine protease
MNLDEAKQRAQAATVRLTKRVGQGVLVPGEFVLTAAHCIDWAGAGEMALGDEFLEDVRPATGEPFRLSVDAVEAVADIAVLGEPDSQQFWDDAEAFQKFRANTPPVPVSSLKLAFGEPARVHVLTHQGEWIEAKVTGWEEPDSLARTVPFEPVRPIEGGTSGGPVIDDKGMLVGVVSTAACTESGGHDSAPPLGPAGVGVAQDHRRAEIGFSRRGESLSNEARDRRKPRRPGRRRPAAPANDRRRAARAGS